jgi:hypothetical protein
LAIGAQDAILPHRQTYPLFDVTQFAKSF